MSRVRWAAGVLPAVLLLSALVSCGGPAAGAASGSAAPSSASPTVLATPTDRSPHGVLLAVQLALRTARRARYSYRLDGQAATGMLFWAPKTVLDLRPAGGGQELVVLDTTAYLGSAHDWTKYTAPLGTIPYSGLVDRIDPVTALDAAVAADGPELVGEERLDGATVRHYRVITTVESFATAQTRLSTERRRALRDLLGQGGVTALAVDLWLNDHDQPVQLSLTGTGTSGRLDQSVQYSDYGSPLSVQAPAESKTRDAGTAALPPAP